MQSGRGKVSAQKAVALRLDDRDLPPNVARLGSDVAALDTADLTLVARYVRALRDKPTRRGKSKLLSDLRRRVGDKVTDMLAANLDVR